MLFGNNSYECIVVEDNDPKHKSKICREFKDKNKINILPWPANSPDMNPIENICGLLKLKIRSKQPKSLMSLKRIINEEWKAFENTYCENLVSSMKNRINSCIAMK